MNILAVEASTSSAKTMIYSTKTKKIYVHTISYPKSISNIKRQDPGGLIQLVFRCIKEIVEKTNIHVDIISLVSVWHSMLLLDENRKPLEKIRTWADVEGGTTVAQYREDELLRSKMYHNTGCNIHCKYPSWKIAYMKEMNLLPARIDRIRVSSVPEYLFEKMTNEIAVSKTTASGTGLLNIHNLEWDEEMLSFLGLKKSQLSSLEELNYVGKLDKDVANWLGLSNGMPVVIPSADGAANQIGEGALKPGSMTLSIGTSAALRLTVKNAVLPKDPATWCYYPGEGKRLIGAATSGAGSAVQWFTKKIGRENHSFQDLEKMLQEVDCKDAPLFLPFLNGEQSPGWRESRMGGFYRMHDGHELKDIYYSILEGIIFNIYQCYEVLVKLKSIPKKIILSGGVVNSRYWVQLVADIFQQPMHISAVEHSSIMGAVSVAQKVSGEIGSLLDVDQEKQVIIQPQKELQAIYQMRYELYRHIYNITTNEVFMK